jgi:predicted metal-binding membrane protein
MPALTRDTRPAVVTAGLAAAAWVVVASGGGPSGHGSFPGFLAHWSAMTAAMMLPGLVPTVRRAGLRVVAPYLAVWTVVGVVLFVLYGGLHGSAAVVVAAGLYELTPLKRRFRERCRTDDASGLDLGLACVGSCLGLMLAGATGPAAMVAATAVVLAQKLLPPRPAVDVPVALAIVGAGVLML